MAKATDAESAAELYADTDKVDQTPANVSAFSLEEMTDDEVETLSKRNRKPKISPFRDLLANATPGKTYKIGLGEEDSATRVVSQLHTGAKQAGIKIKLRNRSQLDSPYIAVTIVDEKANGKH